MSHTKLKIGLGLAALLGMSSVAQAIDYKISGSVNRMIRFADDNEKSDVQHLDNSAAESRLSLTAGTEWNGTRVDINTQMRLDANESSNQGLNQDEGNSDSAELSHAELVFTNDWGALSMGRGDGAARFTQRQDLSGTDLADNFDARRIGSLQFRDMSGFFAGYDGYHAIGQFEGTRTSRLRYDTPSFGGNTFAVSFGAGRSYELGWFFDSAAESASSDAAASSIIASSVDTAFRLIAAAGYIDTGESMNLDTSTTSHCHYCVEDAFSASVSAILGNFIGLTLGYGSSSMTNDSHSLATREFEDIKGYYIKPFIRTGNHAFSLSYGRNNDIDNEVAPMGNRGYDGGSMAIAYQYNGESGIDTYASYQVLEMNGNGLNQDLEDIDVLLAGVRVTF